MTPREGQAQIVSDSPHNLSNPDMSRDKDAKPHLDILLDSPTIILKGVGVDVEPTLLTGHVALYLTESTSIKEITLHFRGKARLPALDPYVTSFVHTNILIALFKPHTEQCSFDIHCLHTRLVILGGREAPQPYAQGRPSPLPLPASHRRFSALKHVHLSTRWRVYRLQTAL
jgi:hypothetical protein